MVADRRRVRSALPFWRKPNWMVPIIVAALNGGAIVGVAQVTSRPVSPVSTAGQGGTVLGNQLSRTPDTWDLTAVGHAGEELSVACDLVANVQVELRTSATTLVAVMCPTPTP